jgi:hypothetical protein
MAKFIALAKPSGDFAVTEVLLVAILGEMDMGASLLLQSADMNPGY